MEQNYFQYQTYEQSNAQYSYYSTGYESTSYPYYAGNQGEFYNYQVQNDLTYQSPTQNRYVSNNSSPEENAYNKRDWSQDYGSFYASNNESYNDSAYQTQLDNSQYNFLNSYNIESSNDKKRKRVETESNNENLNALDTSSMNGSKRPKVLKLENYEPESEFTCQECSLCFTSKAKFLLHEFKAHKNGSSCVCPVCYKRFGNQANTLVHLRGHTQEKTYKCNQCPNAFYDSSTLKKHLRTHSGEKPYECNLCTKKFTQSGNLKRHLLVHKKYDEDKVLYDEEQSRDVFKNENFQFDWSQYQSDSNVQISNVLYQNENTNDGSFTRGYYY